MNATIKDVVHKTLTDRIIDSLSNLRQGEPVNLTIDSPGGSVRYGWQLFKALREASRNGHRVTVDIQGKAASMASVLAMAADRIRIERNAKFMIHDASLTPGGNPMELRAMADLLDKLSDELAATYAARSGQPADKVRALMKVETVMTAQEAHKAGFVDEVYIAQPLNSASLLDRIAALERSLKETRNLDMPVEAVARRSERLMMGAGKDLANMRKASKSPHLDKFESLRGAMASAYFKKHKKQISAELTRRGHSDKINII